VGDYIKNAAKFWLNFGLDGYRIDHVIGLSNKYLKEFSGEIKKSYPNSILIGEAWMKGIKFKELNTIKIPKKRFKWIKNSPSDNLFKNYIGIIDGVLDFKFNEIIKSFIIHNNFSLEQYTNYLKKHYKLYPKDFLLPNFLDNHDMNRFLFECNNDKNKLMKAAEYQFKTDQPIIIYYGTEVGLNQNKSIWDSNYHGDIQARMPMKWKDQDEKLLNYYKNLIKNRKINSANY
jgi:glycosidase